MHIRDIFREHATTFSFEFFPPKSDEAAAELFGTIGARPASGPTTWWCASAARPLSPWSPT
jgi:methylenetetrahydrofolate reductase (NADPH)